MGMFDQSLEAANNAVSQSEKQQGQLSPEMTADLVLLDVAKIHPDPDQPRKEWLPDELEELKASIAQTKGCRTPIKVRPHPEIVGEYMLVYGEGRWLSHNHLGFTTIPALLDTDPREDFDLRFEQLTENLSRKSMTRYDEAAAIKQLMELHTPKMKQKQIAETLGKPTSFISRLLKLLKAPKAVQDLSRNGVTQNINVLDSLTRISELISEDELENYVECVVSGAISEKDLQAALSDFKSLTESEGQDEEPLFMTEEHQGDLRDPLPTSESSGEYSDSEPSQPEQDYGFYDYGNIYEKALFDALWSRDMAFEISEEQKDEATDKLEQVCEELEAEKLAKVNQALECFKDALPTDQMEAMKVILNIRKLRALFRDALVNKLQDTEQSDEASTTPEHEEIADLQFTLEAYEVFEDHVVINLSGGQHTLTITKDELRAMLED